MRLLRYRKAVLLVAFGLATLLPPAGTAAQGVPQSPLPGGGFRIAGTVVNALGGNALARARVTIFDVTHPQDIRFVITSDDGHFEFTELGASKYSLQAAKRGFIEEAYNQHDQFSTAIVTGAGLDTEHLVLRLPPFAVLSGRVLDESGEPVQRAMVSLYREDRQTGVGRIRRMSNAQTDDLGSYEFAELVSGNYFLAVSATPWYAVHPSSPHQQDAGDAPSAVDPALDVAYPVTYYKDATEPDEASPIPIRGGDHLEVDLRLTPAPALRLLFHVPDNGEHGFNQPILQEPAFDGVEQVPNNGGMEMVSPGVYALTGVPAGHYTIRTYGSPEQGSTTTDVEMDVTRDSQELDPSKGEPASTVKASVQFGSEAVPREFQIALRNSKRRVVDVEAVSDKGEAQFQNVAPGKYEVLAQGTGKAYTVASISTEGGGVISGNILNVAAASSPTITLTIVGSEVKVEGVVKRNGQAVPGAMVVLVPNDPESNHRLFRRDQSDLDGSFSLQGVIPGSYTIVAIEDGWDLDWSSPGVIAHYCQHGKVVTVGGPGRNSVRLEEAVEAQRR